MDRRYYGIGIADIRKLAYQIALKNGLRHPFSKQNEVAGKKWLKGFFKRHSALSLRKPQGISKSRIKGFTPENVNRFFDLLEPAMETINYNPARVYNVDETGITTVQSKNSRVITLKGKKQVGAVTAAERGALVTVVMCMNATGGFVPPLFIFPRKNMKAELLDGAPPGSIAACHPSGWIQQHIFSQWLQHFISHVKPSRKDPVLLILDGHYSHTRNMDVIDAGRKNHVTIVCIPPHTSHKMQPLDLSFMSPFKTYYSQQVQMWLKQNHGRNVNAFQICKLMCPAYLKSATAEVSVNGFRKSGIYPFNRNNFSEHEFITERQRERTPPVETIERQRERTPSAETVQSKLSENPIKNIIRAEEISPLPSCSGILQANGGRKSRQGSSWVITSSPYKKQLEESLQEQTRKKEIKENRKNVKLSSKLTECHKKKTASVLPKGNKNKKNWFNNKLFSLREHLRFLRELYVNFKYAGLQTTVNVFRAEYRRQLRLATIKANNDFIKYRTKKEEVISDLSVNSFNEYSK